MADISIKEAQAKQWISEVNDEVETVRGILKKVATESVAVPGEDDAIMNGIEKTCKLLDNAWNSMIDKFRKAGGEIGNVVDILASAAGELADAAGQIGKLFR